MDLSFEKDYNDINTEISKVINGMEEITRLNSDDVLIGNHTLNTTESLSSTDCTSDLDFTFSNSIWKAKTPSSDKICKRLTFSNSSKSLLDFTFPNKKNNSLKYPIFSPNSASHLSIAAHDAPFQSPHLSPISVNDIYLNSRIPKKDLHLNLPQTGNSGNTQVKKSYKNNIPQKFWININEILSEKDRRTTVMIREIPKKYTLQLLLEEFKLNFENKFDVLYMPVDYYTNSNFGLAFLNFIDPLHWVEFVDMYSDKQWNLVKSIKNCKWSYAKIQGKAALQSNFNKGKIMLQSQEKLPIIFATPSELPEITLPKSYINEYIIHHPNFIFDPTNWVNNKIIINRTPSHTNTIALSPTIIYPNTNSKSSP